MQSFPTSFLLLFYQISLGGLFAMAAAPFHELQRGFFKSTGIVLFIIGALSFWGKLDLYWRSLSGGFHLSPGLEMAFHLLFLIVFGLYLFSLWREDARFRARAFSLSLFLGLAGLVLNSYAFHDAPAWSLESFFYPISLILSSLLLGGVTVGMLIGHWYLIDTGQSIEPFRRVFRFFFISLLLQAAFLLLSPVFIYFFAQGNTVASLQRLWAEHFVLLFARVVVAQVAPLSISLMIQRTLEIPHTMAATGLFYIALLGVFVGEILSRQILALTALPF